MTKLTKALTISCALLSSTMMTACVHEYNGTDQAMSVADNFPIEVAETTATLELAVEPGQRGLNTTDRANLAAFVSAYKQKGRGQIKVAAPTSTSNASSASRVAKAIAANIADTGVESGAITRTSYPASPGDAAAPVIVSFSHYEASVNNCGVWDHNMATNSRNVPWNNFGCAAQNNLAAMVEDPGDLIAPRNMTGADADRRSTVLKNYRTGETTAATRTEAESADVSNVE